MTNDVFQGYIKELIIWTNGSGFTPEQIKQLHAYMLRNYTWHVNYLDVYMCLVLVFLGIRLIIEGSKKQYVSSI